MIGILPTEDPQLIVYVVVQNPRGQSYYGSQIAAPIFRDVVTSIMDKLGIPRAGTVGVAAPREDGPSAGPGAVPSPRPSPGLQAQQSSTAGGTALQIGSAMPDLRGTPKKLLLPLLLRKDLAVTINGSGYVVTAGPAPGNACHGWNGNHPGAAVSFLADNLAALSVRLPLAARGIENAGAAGEGIPAA